MLGTSALSLSLLLLLALLLRADGGGWRPCCTDDDDIVRHRMRSSSPDLLMLRPCALPTMTACLPLHGDGDGGDIEKARTNSTGTVRRVPEEHAAAGADELRQQQHAMKKRRQQRQSAGSGAPADRWIIVGSKWRIGERMAVERSASWSIAASIVLPLFPFSFIDQILHSSHPVHPHPADRHLSVDSLDSLDKILAPKLIQMESY